jgi:hypothetical protein
MSDIVENPEPAITETEQIPTTEPSDNEQVPLEKAVKPKKPRTEKQMEAFRVAQQKRAANLANKKAAKAA